MQMEKLSANVRESNGKGPSRRVRTEGRVPGVVYGHVEKPASISLNLRQFEQIMSHHKGGNALVELEIEGAPDVSGPTMVKDIQRHPSREHIIHIDFQRIDMDEKVQMNVPVTVVGNIAGVLAGGVLQHHRRELLIEVTPRVMPEEIEVDLSSLKIGEGFRVGQMEPIEGIRILSDPQHFIARILAARVSKTAKGPEAGADAEAGDKD